MELHTKQYQIGVHCDLAAQLWPPKMLAGATNGVF